VDCIRCGASARYNRALVDLPTGEIRGGLCTDCEAGVDAGTPAFCETHSRSDPRRARPAGRSRPGGSVTDDQGLLAYGSGGRYRRTERGRAFLADETAPDRCPDAGSTDASDGEADPTGT
jgi:hypothetical protein